MVKNILKIVCFFECIVFAFAGDVSSSSFVIDQIKIEGNQRVESDTILSYISVRSGSKINDSEIDNCLKSLFATGYFNDVKVDKKGKNLVIIVEENPIINQIAFEGNDKLKDEDLKREVHLRPREVLSQNKIQFAQQRILEIYRRMGRFGAKVEPKIIKLSENRVNLVFEIKEGAVTQVRKINFIGNKNFSDSKIKPHLLTKEARWYRFFANDDVYDPDRFLGDQQALIQFYYNHGYPDFRIVSAIAELTPDQKDFYITFTVEEGNKYKFGDVKIESAIKNVKIEPLYKEVIFSKGDTFSMKGIDQTIKKMINAITAQGYAFVNIEHDIEKDHENNVACITFKIAEGPRVYIESIEISGNDRTRDYVIRREVQLSEGDAYNGKLIKDSEKNIKNLDYFKEASIEIQEGSAPDKVKLVVHVTEQPTGELSASTGFSSLDGLIFGVGIKEKNFRGTSQILHTNVTVSKNAQGISAGIIEPYFLNRKLEASADVFYNKYTRSKEYKQSNFGTVLGVLYPISGKWWQKLSYGIELDKMYGVGQDESPILKSQAKNAVKSWVGQTLIYDNRNIEDKEIIGGYYYTYATSFAGVGGNISYLRHDLDLTHYWSVADEVVLKLYGGVGAIQKTGKTIRVVDSFSLGGDSLRGFDYYGVGPRDSKSSLGGTKIWISTLELRFPLGLPKEWEIKGATFIDAGSLWKPGQSNDSTRDKNTPRVSAGFGISWRSPFGPLSIYYGRVIKREKFDHTKPVIVQFTTVF